jgi:hypothetical protein
MKQPEQIQQKTLSPALQVLGVIVLLLGGSALLGASLGVGVGIFLTIIKLFSI